ncbi:MAG TPA: ABC transporter substrate-binding protein [Clostridiales bacterium]|nr:ABC transporter substrate-binding protein [Clostridiales bacterium]
MQANIKRILFLLMAMVVAMGLLAGCAGSGQSSSPASSQEPEASASQPEETSPAESQELPNELPPDPLPLSKPAARVAALKGPTGMGLAELMDKNEKAAALCDYTFTLESAPDVIQGPLINGDLDIAILPTNLAAVLYHKTEGAIQLMAVSGMRVLYVMAAPGVEINSFADLKGKKLFTAGQGSTQEYVLDYLLRQNGLDPATDLTVEYKAEQAEAMAQLLAGNCDAALLPQPFVTNATVKNPEIKKALDVTAEWEKATDESQLPMSCVVVRKEFAQQNPESVANFLEEYDESTKWVSANAEEAAALIGKYDIVPEEVAKLAIPDSAIQCQTGSEAEEAVNAYLKVLFEQNPKSVGGALPDEGFFYRAQ